MPRIISLISERNIVFHVVEFAARLLRRRLRLSARLGLARLRRATLRAGVGTRLAPPAPAAACRARRRATPRPARHTLQIRRWRHDALPPSPRAIRRRTPQASAWCCRRRLPRRGPPPAPGARPAKAAALRAR